ncbi:MAG: cytochrome b/b6 domain-containing protein [Bacteroidales bacterium]|nr:cytochrome b/b6 domain-containing protein [Bacteroidales bacterium]MCF8457845.1 cytochrome b/b6 domain-containing protein [Bacteroidales bacterium]
MSEEKIYLYPIWVRIWHWLNAISFLALVLSGISMQYASSGFSIIPFELSVTMHNITGIAVTFLTLIFIIVNRFTDNGFYYNMTTKTLATRLFNQSKYYLYGKFKGEKPPYPISMKRKFNPLQRLAYVVVMYIFMPLLIISGIGLFFPEIIPAKVFAMNGILLTAVLHVIMGFLCSLFLVVHLYLCTMGSSVGALFKGMITGYHQ